MRRILFAFAIATAVLGCAKKDDADAAPKGEKVALKEMTVEQVATKLAAKDGKTFIYDNNRKEMFEKEHVPSAKWLDDENITAADLPNDKGALLIFYCHNES
jgi:hypothetical protein